MLANVRSIYNKFEEIKTYIELEKPLIVVLTETWMQPNDTSGFEIENYVSLHRCRQRKDKLRGGGVSIYLSSSITIFSHCFPEKDEVEAISVIFRPNYLPRSTPWLSIIAIYYPPSDIFHESLLMFINDQTDLLLTKNLKGTILLLGDFNDLDTEKLSARKHFKQIVDTPTRLDKILDLCFIKSNIKFYTKVKSPISTSDHSTVFIYPMDNLSNSSQKINYSVRPKKQSSMDTFGKIVSNMDWSGLYELDDIDDAALLLRDNIKNVYEKSFPVSQKFKNINDHSWCNADINALINKKNYLYKKDPNSDELNILTKLIKTKIKEAKIEEFNRDIRVLNSGSADFYKFINKSTGNYVIRNKFCFQDKTQDQTVEEIGLYFKSLANSIKPLDRTLLPAFRPGLPIKPATTIWTLKQLQILPNKKDSSPDGFPCFILNNFAIELCDPITFIINLSIKKGIYPKCWKEENIILIPKQKAPNSPDQIRPLSISSNIAKICERYVYSFLLPEIRPFVDEYQFGGLPKRSTTQYLVRLVDRILMSLESNKLCATSLITDFTKAFNFVDHNIVMDALIEMKTSSSVIDWIASFLDNRSQIIKLPVSGNEVRYHCSNGVPQGSVLSGIIFIAATNNIALNINYRFRFIDDLTLINVADRNEITRHTQNALDVIIKDSNKQGMYLNSQKCAIMTHDFTKNRTNCNVYIDQKLLVNLTSCKILGVTIQFDLRWNYHVSEIVSKAMKKFFILYRLKTKKACSKIMLLVYYSFIRPNLEYCCPVWNSALTKELTNKIEGVQKRALKLILGDSFINYQNALSVLNMKSLEERRNELTLKFAKSFFVEFPTYLPESCFSTSGINTRNSNKLFVSYIRTKRYKNSSIPYMINLLNDNM